MKKSTSKTSKKMISEYGGKEKYASKAAKMKHEKAEGKKVEKKEKMGTKKTTSKSAAKKKPFMYGN
jgi:hypothetical protein